jgi:hypothetical protein
MNLPLFSRAIASHNAQGEAQRERACERHRQRKQRQRNKRKRERKICLFSRARFLKSSTTFLKSRTEHSKYS